MKVLVAEDNLFTLQQYKHILEKKGCEVIIAHDGMECIQKFDDAFVGIDPSAVESGPFDVMLIDNNMPKKNGAEVVNEILKRSPKQRIIFASAYNINSILNASESLMKSVEILQKPFSLNTMITKIQTKLQVRNF